MDVEGWEDRALLGALNTITAFKVPLQLTTSFLFYSGHLILLLLLLLPLS